VSQPPGYFTNSLLSKTQKIAWEKQTNPKKKKKRGYERWSGRKAHKTIKLVTRGCQTMGRGGDGTKPNNKTKTVK
jgi:hypothetical protein